MLALSRTPRVTTSYARPGDASVMAQGGATIGITVATVLSPMIVHASRLPDELLARADVEHEPLVMLESTPDGALVRKLTPAEKVQYAERTGESVFFGSAAEMDEAVLGVPVDHPAAD